MRSISIFFDIIRDTNDVIHAELLHDKYDEIIRLLSELRGIHGDAFQ